MKKLTITLSINEELCTLHRRNPSIQTAQNNRLASEQDGDNCTTVSMCIEYSPEQIGFLNQILDLLPTLVSQKIQPDIETCKLLKEVKDQY